MQVTIKNPEMALPVIKRAFYLAWQACGNPSGMGVLQDRPHATEEEVFQNAFHGNDYSGTNHFRNQVTEEKGKVYGDYVFGRMMKIGFSWNNGLIAASDSKPDPDYRAWAGDYSSELAIILRAARELQAELELLS